MGDLKIYVPDELEEKFRKASMEKHGYGRGSISKSATEAIKLWLEENSSIPQGFMVPEDPVEAIRGLLKDVRKSSVELQHLASFIRTRRALGK